jgi:hypothetical protein
MVGGHHVAELASGGTFNLAHYVALTDAGDRWVNRIREIRDAEMEDDGGDRQAD